MKRLIDFLEFMGMVLLTLAFSASGGTTAWGVAVIAWAIVTVYLIAVDVKALVAERRAVA